MKRMWCQKIRFGNKQPKIVVVGDFVDIPALNSYDRRYTLRLSEHDLDVLDNFVHEFVPDDTLLDEHSDSVFRRICDLWEQLLTDEP